VTERTGTSGLVSGDLVDEIAPTLRDLALRDLALRDPARHEQ
jgi:hypothetical protein